MNVLVSGSSGFIGGYVVEELLARGYSVVGIDNHSKYGKVAKSYDDHPDYRLVEGDARDVELMTELLVDCDHFIAGAAMIGGISYFHAYAYDLLATNERIMAASCDAAIKAHQERPAPEGHLHELVDGVRVHRHVALGRGRRAHDRPAAVVLRVPEARRRVLRPGGVGPVPACPTPSSARSTASGIGEGRALGDVEVPSGNVKLAMSHVVPDLVQKVLKGQDPLHILGDGTQVRHYTYGGDLARGIVTAMEHPDARNDDFNLSTAQSTTVLELAEVIWRKIKGPTRRSNLVSDEAYEHDVARRVPVHREGPAGARLRGHHLARGDARRGDPVDRAGRRRRPHLTQHLTPPQRHR